MNKKGFTLVELLTVMAILAILMVATVPSVFNLIKKSREEHDKNIVNTAIMAAKSYVLDNKKVAPKYIGDSAGIFFYELKNKNYLKEDLKDSKKKSCMSNSYIKVFKSDTKEYVYNVYLDCAGRKITNDSINDPTINIFLTNKNGGIVNSKDVTKDEAYEMAISNVRITMFGDNSGKGKKQCDENLVANDYGIIGYSIFIYKYTDIDKNKYVEIYNSGSLPGNRKKCLDVEVDLSKYMDVTQRTQLKIVVRANNEKGGETTEIFDARFDDKEGPTCEVIDPISKDDWSNKSERFVKVKCIDLGSGCQREYYSKIFNKEMGMGTIKMKDNKNNESSCSVLVNLDRTPPECTNISKENDASGENYLSGSWRNVNIYTSATCSEDGASGCVNVKKITTRGKTTNVKKELRESWTVKAEGKSATQWFVYDKAGNEGKCSEITENIDKQSPTCTVSGGSNSWTNGSRTIKATCTDKGGSNCKETEFSKKYDSDIDTTKAGAVDNEKGGSFYDKAGNKVDCLANQTVKIDTVEPVITAKTVKAIKNNLSIEITDNVGLKEYAITSSSEFPNSGWKTASGTSLKETFTKKAGDYYVHAKDIAGNSKTSKKIVVQWPKTFGKHLRDTKTAGYNTTELGRMYRYTGATANNFVCIGTTDKKACVDDKDTYMYRVIGVVKTKDTGMGTSKDMVKVISENTNHKFMWYGSNADKFWSDSNVRTGVNNISIPGGYDSKIADINWRHGKNFVKGNSAKSAFNIEKAWNKTSKSKIAVMYVSDYLYATGNKNQVCIDTTGYSACKNSWIHKTTSEYNKTNFEWTMNYAATKEIASYSAIIIRTYTVAGDNEGALFPEVEAVARRSRPVFYLKEAVYYKSGSGTVTDPFIIE